MKKTIKLICFLIFSVLILLFNINIEDNNPIPIMQINTIENIQDLQLYGDYGWALTLDNKLLHTNDGINNFNAINIPVDITEKSNVDVFFYDKNTCYLMRYYESEIIISSTFDSGITWNSTSIPAEYGNYGTYLSMINEKEGYLLYCSGANPIKIKLYYTDDGCRTFSFHSDVAQINSYVNGFYISPKGTAYITTDFRGNVINTTMFESFDLVNWTECNLNLEQDSTHYVYDTPVYLNSDNGFMFLCEQTNSTLGSFQRTYFLETNDGGTNWEKIYRISKKTKIDIKYVKISANTEKKEIYLVDNVGKLYLLNIK